MRKLAALVVLATAVAPLFGASPKTPTPLPPSATLFNDSYSFTNATPTHSASITVGTDGAWLKSTSSNGGGWMNCSDRYQVSLVPNFSPYATLLGLGPTPVDVCFGERCYSCSPQWGGGSKSWTYHTTDTDPGIVFAGSGQVTLSELTDDAESLYLRLEQYNRADMTGMTIFHSREEDNPEPLQPSDPERYFIATGADKVPVVAELLWGSVDKFPAGPNVTYTANWDTGSVVDCEVNPSPLMPYGYSIVGVPVPKMSTGKHKFTVTAKLPSGKTFTSTNSIEVMVYAHNIYIGIEGTFQPKNPVDQLPQFVPGAALNGSNLDLRTTPQMLQLNILIGRGSSGTFDVKLTNVSRYPGIAMNYPLDSADTSPDIDFGSGDVELFEVPIPKGGAPKVVKLPLHVHDYAASATIEVTMPYRKTTFTARRRIPLDADGNKLPDAGWRVTSEQISSLGLDATTDRDQEDANGPGGDGLSAFEEFRGFILGGGYVRLDPRRRDLFLVADPLFIVNYNIVNGLTPLPLSVQYGSMTEVKGETYAPRNLEKIKPVVNPNRSGVPGARSDGQRAVRLIYQNQQYPNVTAFVPTLPGFPPQEIAVQAWQVGLFGATVLDGVNPSAIDRTTSGQYIVDITPQSPDGTQFVEFYERSFRNTGMYTEFDHAAYHDASGSVVPRCTTSDPTDPNYVNPETCDDWDIGNFMIVPHRLPGDYFTFHTVPETASEFFTVPAYTCSALNTRIVGGHTSAQMQELRRSLALHEVGHAMHMIHARFNCGDLMFDTENIGSPRRAMPDIVPVPSTYSPYDILQIFLWQ